MGDLGTWLEGKYKRWEKFEKDAGSFIMKDQYSFREK